jgi:DNA replication protein DnaC
MAKAKIRTHSNLDRSLGLVKPDLLDVLRRLVGGKLDWPLFLYGEAGVGKTRAALALCDHVPFSYYLTAERICGEILGGTDYITWRYLKDYNLVVMDELGTRQNAGDLEYTACKRVADEREDKPAIFISNVAPNDLVTVYDDRLASRILCRTVYHLIDADRRRTT